MAEARVQSQWARTSSLMALIANCNRDPKKRKKPFVPADFDPFRKPVKPPKVSIRVLKDVFIDKRMPGEVLDAIHGVAGK